MDVTYVFQDCRILRNKPFELFMCGWLLFGLILAAGPIILHVFEYRTYESVPNISVGQPAEQPTSATYTIDNNGQKHWTVNAYSSVHVMEGVKLIQHVYLFGIIADRLDILSNLETLRDIYEVITMSMLVHSLMMGIEGSKGLTPFRLVRKT